MRIITPEGFAPPANVKPGEAFEVVATVKPYEDGSGFTIVALDGMPMPEDEEAPEEEMMEEKPVNERVDATKVRLPFGEEESNEYA